MSETIEQRVSNLEKQLENLQNQRKDQLSMVVFSNDMDKILAALVIAVGAAAMDTQVKMFFTFWGISALRDKNKKTKGKDVKSKMFGAMLPHGISQLKLSKMNIGGVGKVISATRSLTIAFSFLKAKAACNRTKISTSISSAAAPPRMTPAAVSLSTLPENSAKVNFLFSIVCSSYLLC